MREKKFTLIELLVVIAIIAVLAGMLLPALGSVKKTSQAASCGSNLKGIGTFIQLYADSNDDWTMYSGLGSNADRWTLCFEQAVDKAATTCETAKNSTGDEFLTVGTKAQDGKTVNTNYVFNAQSYGRKMSSLQKSASAQSMLADGVQCLLKNANSGYVVQYWQNFGLSMFDGARFRWNTIWGVHRRGQANLLWLDGHVEARDTYGLYTEYETWDLNNFALWKGGKRRKDKDNDVREFY